MKYWFSALLLIVSSTLLAAPAPDFKLNDIQLSDLQGKVVYLDFWASWCKPCRKSFPWMNQMAQKYSDQGLVILAVNLDTDRALAEKFLAQLPAQFNVLYDPEGSVAKQYKLPGMPTSYLIDKQGQMRLAHKGFFTQKTAKYEEEITSLLKE